MKRCAVRADSGAREKIKFLVSLRKEYLNYVDEDAQKA